MAYNSVARRGPILRNDYRPPNHSEPNSNSPLRPRSDFDLRSEYQRQKEKEFLRDFFEKTLQNLDTPENMFPPVPDYNKLYPKGGSCPVK